MHNRRQVLFSAPVAIAAGSIAVSQPLAVPASDPMIAAVARFRAAVHASGRFAAELRAAESGNDAETDDIEERYVAALDVEDAIAREIVTLTPANSDWRAHTDWLGGRRPRRKL